MSHTTRIVTGIVCATLTLGTAGVTPSTTRGPQIAPADERAAIVEFSRRIQAYADLHRRLEGPVPTVANSTDPRAIRQAIDRLGNAIRAERTRARRGDVFTPEIVAIVRRIIRESCQSDFRALLETVHEDHPPIAAPRVNGRWPGERFPFMPPELLRALPPLPEELQYLFVNRDLVLWDWHADVVVDVMPNAIPHETSE